MREKSRLELEVLESLARIEGGKVRGGERDRDGVDVAEEGSTSRLGSSQRCTVPVAEEVDEDEEEEEGGINSDAPPPYELVFGSEGRNISTAVLGM